jgi:hypothetical protein
MPTQREPSRADSLTGTALASAIGGDVEILGREVVPSQTLGFLVIPLGTSTGVFFGGALGKMTWVDTEPILTEVVNRLVSDLLNEGLVEDSVGPYDLSIVPCESVPVRGPCSKPVPASSRNLGNLRPQPRRNSRVHKLLHVASLHHRH